MRIELIKKENLVTNQWSGGTTTQLAIYPNDADYKEKNFIFRLSSAKVEAEESDFTKLPGVDRKIMVLDGTLKLEHKDQHTTVLQKFETDSFKGDWDTKSYGKVTDFNLMTTNNASGELSCMSLKKNYQQLMTLFNDHKSIAFYAYEGSFFIKTAESNVIVENGDMVLLHSEDYYEYISIRAIDPCEIIISKITY